MDVNVITCAVEMPCERCVRMRGRDKSRQGEILQSEYPHFKPLLCLSDVFNILLEIAEDGDCHQQ